MKVKKAVLEEDGHGNKVITQKFLEELCEENNQYLTPHLNDSMYLHYKGITKIENLERYYELKCLWMECNGIRRIENLDHFVKMRTLYLHQNLISKIEGLDTMKLLVTLNLSNNKIKVIENLDQLPMLKNLDLSHNFMQETSDLHGLRNCDALTSVRFRFAQLLLNILFWKFCVCRLTCRITTWSLPRILFPLS